MNREPVPTTENPTGSNGVPAGYGPATPNPAPGVAQGATQVPAPSPDPNPAQNPAPSPAPAAAPSTAPAPSPAPAPAAGFQSGDIAHTQAAQDKEYFRQDEPTSRWARLRKWLKEHYKAALAILLGSLVLLGLLVWLVVWLVGSVTAADETAPTEWIGEVTEEDEDNAIAAALNAENLINEPTTSDKELIDAISTEMNALANEASQFTYLLEITYLLAVSGREELSLEYLNTINTDKLDDDQLYTYYSHCATIHLLLENEEQANYYRELMGDDLNSLPSYGV